MLRVNMKNVNITGDANSHQARICLTWLGSLTGVRNWEMTIEIP